MLKRKSKRVLSIVLAVAMIVGLFPVAAFANDGEPTTPVDQNTETVATKLPEADDGVIKLTKDVQLTSTVNITSDTVIDLQGHKITYTYSNNDNGGVLFNVQSGTLTLRDSVGNGVAQVTDTGSKCVQVHADATFALESGMVESTEADVNAQPVIANWGNVKINGGTVKGTTCIYNSHPASGNPSWAGKVATCSISDGEIIGLPDATETSNKGASYGVCMFGPGVAQDGSVDNSKMLLDISGGRIEAVQGIATNASSGAYAGFTFNMTGGIVDGTENGTGMYLPAIGITNISGGTVTGAQGIRICAGELDITGGTIQGTALADGSDLVAGGSGGTNGALVIGKAGNGYVGDIDVNISGSASIINTAEKVNDTVVAPAIVVSDKNMALASDQPIKDANNQNVEGATFNYSKSMINVTINAPVSGDIVKISNLTQDTTTSDGGNTNLNLDNSTVNGNVINQSGTNMSVENTTVTGKVSNSSNGSIIINNSIVTGAVTNTGTNGNLAVLDSNVGSTDENVTMVNSTVNGAPVEDTATGNVEAFIGATPYETLENAIAAAQDRDVVTLVKDAVVDANGKKNNQGILTITKNITINGNGKTITAENVTDTPSMINVQSDANVTINDLIINGETNDTFTEGTKHGININQAGTVTLNDVTIQNNRWYAVMNNGSDLVLNGLTTSGNQWGVNIDNKGGAAVLTVNNATINENSSIVFDKYDADGKTPKAVINAGSFKHIIANGTVQTPDLLINGGTFATGEGPDGSVAVEKYLASGLEFNPVTGQVYKEPEYTGKYSYEIFTKVGENGTISVDRYATEGDNVTITVSPDEAYLLDELTVTANGKEVEVKDNGDGTYTFKMPSADAKIVVTFAEDPDWEPAPEMPFTDVNEGDWFYDVVLYAYDNGLMTGVSATEFAPNQTTTRGMIVSMLARLEGVTSAEGAGFADVAANDWYATAVNWAASVGVVNGYEDNTFRPNAPITREQMAAILYNYADYKGYDVSARADLSDYADAASISSWAEDVLAWANAEGLINGMTATTIDPQGATTRAQTAAMFERFLTAHEA